jgi:RHS repeat-associated protein
MVGTTKYYLHADALGSTRLVMTSTPSVQFSSNYRPYGLTYSMTGSETFKYTGKMYDGVTGLYYFNARWYDPSTGRFVTQDSYTGSQNDPMTLNRYVYARDDPERYVDPTGHGMHIMITDGGSDDPSDQITASSSCVNDVCTVTTTETYGGYISTISTTFGSETSPTGVTTAAMAITTSDTTPVGVTMVTTSQSVTTTLPNGQSTTKTYPTRTSTYTPPSWGPIDWNPKAAQSMVYFISGAVIMGSSYFSGVPSLMIATTATQVEVANYMATTSNPDPNHVLGLYILGYGEWIITLGLGIAIG